MTFTTGGGAQAQPPPPSVLDRPNPQSFGEFAEEVNRNTRQLFDYLLGNVLSLDPGTVGGEKPLKVLIEEIVGKSVGKVVSEFLGDKLNSGGDVLSDEQIEAIRSQLNTYSAAVLVGEAIATAAKYGLLAPPQLNMWLTDP